MNQLFPVVLQKTDTCLTYCYKRVGYEMVITSSRDHSVIEFYTGRLGKNPIAIPKSEILTTDHERLEDNFDLIPLTVDTNKEGDFKEPYIQTDVASLWLQLGDLLLFSDKAKLTVIADRIDAEGNIHYSNQIIRRHVAVYEGNGLVSHAYWGHNTEKYESITAMQIEIKKLSDFKQQPTHVLWLKQP